MTSPWPPSCYSYPSTRPTSFSLMGWLNATVHPPSPSPFFLSCIWLNSAPLLKVLSQQGWPQYIQGWHGSGVGCVEVCMYGCIPVCVQNHGRFAINTALLLCLYTLVAALMTCDPHGGYIMTVTEFIIESQFMTPVGEKWLWEAALWDVWNYN